MSAFGGPAPPSPRVRLTFGPFVLDPLRGELRRDGNAVPLRPKAFDLLRALASRPGEVVGKDELLATVWPGVVVGEDSLAQCVHELRAALGADGAAFVRTVPRRGYRFDGEVRSEPAALPPAPLPPTAPAPMPAAAAGTRSPSLAVAAALLATVLALAVLAWQRAPRMTIPAVPAKSVVVLPLEIEAPGDTPAWFADALTADLTAALAQMPGLLVISRDTAAPWKGKLADPREVAHALGVRYVVHGRVRRSGEQVRLALTLDDGTTGAQEWSDRFELERARLAASVDDVVQQIARRLHVQLYRSIGAGAAALSPEQVGADDLAMEGWSVYFRGYTPENFRAALALFEQAVARDARSVTGWGGVAIVNGLGAGIGWLPDRDAALARLEFASARLQELDANHLFTLLARANVASLRGDYEAHLLITTMITERFPNHAPSHASVGLALLNLGRFEQCVEPLQHAIRLSPGDPMLGLWNWRIGACHFMRGQYDEAARFALIAEQVNPRLPLAPLLRAASLARAGRSDEARRIVEQFRRQSPDYRAADVAKVMRSEQPAYAAGRARMIDSLRELGLP